MGLDLCCCCSKDEPHDPKREICRLKTNWFFITVIASLYAISYTSVSSSFHQFITNPREQDINMSQPGMDKLEPGLGESEAFYSWVITVFNVGAIVGALSGGLLLKFLPYWHMLLASLFLHTLGYVLYAVATTGWLVMLSKLLSGVFIGAEMTLALAYFGESNVNYREAIIELGKEEKKAIRVKHLLFALHSVGVNIGYIFGPGVAVIFAQFPINQFRSIAWYNAAMGVAIIILQILIFKGESDCTKLTKSKCSCGIVDKPDKVSHPGQKSTSRAFTLAILIFLVGSRAVLSFRFCVYETLFNPILSDSFGFSERDASYFFFGLVAAQIMGTIVLLVFQQLHLSSRLVAVIGLTMSIIATALMGDWQAIRPDSCTGSSLFHHPELLHNYTTQLQTQATPQGGSLTDRFHCERLNLSIGLQEHLSGLDIYVFPTVNEGMDSGCTLVDSCPVCSQRNMYRTYSAEPTCLHLRLDPTRQCLQPIPAASVQARPHPQPSSYSCSMRKSSFTFCVTVPPAPPPNKYASVEEYVTDVHIQSVLVIEGRVSKLAMEQCEEHPHSSCHWNPKSDITDKYCEDCPPICRKESNYLEFSQFAIGAALLLISVPVARVPITSLISDIVAKDGQGLVMGLAQALNAVARSVGPLWLDAAYEGPQKRTFLAMAICIACYLFILIGVLVLYPKLVPPRRNLDGHTDTDSESERDLESCSDSDYAP